MALYPLDALVAVNALLGMGQCRPHTLGIHHTDARFGISSVVRSLAFCQHIQNGSETASFAPRSEMMVYGLPMAESRRNHVPLTARFHNIGHCIEQFFKRVLPQTGSPAAKARIDQKNLGWGQVSRESHGLW